MKNLTFEVQNILINHAIDGMERISEGHESRDVHSTLFNEDYFIIGYGAAEEFLNKVGTFHAIGEVQGYEKDNFGECNTDLGSSEKVANMFAYIKGEEILNDCPTIQKRWSEKLTVADIKRVVKELKAQLRG